MKKNRLEKVFIGIFLAIVLTVCGSILIRAFTQEVCVNILSVNNSLTYAILSDLIAEETPADTVLENDQVDMLAPFYTDHTGAQQQQAVPDEPTSVDPAVVDTFVSNAQPNSEPGALEAAAADFRGVVTYIEKGITNWATGNLAGYRTWVSAAYGYNKILNWKVTPRNAYNGVIFLRDGQLTTYIGKKDMTYKAESVLELKSLADEYGIRFLYVQYPYKIRETDPESGRLDFSNQNANQTIGLLKEGGVSVLDLRDAWDAYRPEDSNSFRRDAYYITDQHWRAETGLWAAGTIGKYINDNFGIPVDLSVFEPDRYRYDVYEDRLLGSYGRQVTLALADPEDFTLVYPDFETSFDFPLLHGVSEADLSPEQMRQLSAVWEREHALNGSFEMFLDYSMLEPGNYYKKVAYFAYVDNVHDLVYTHNNLNQSGTSVLFLTDSFARTTAPFFALGVTDTKRIRPDAFGGSWRTYFEVEKPDVVVYFLG